MLLTVFERCPKENISRARSGEMTRCVNEKTHKDGINELGAWKIRLKNQQSVHVARCRYLQYKLWTKSIHGASMIKTQYSHPFAQLLPAPEFEVRYVSGRKRCPRTPLRSYDKQFQSIEILSNETSLHTLLQTPVSKSTWTLRGTYRVAPTPTFPVTSSKYTPA